MKRREFILKGSMATTAALYTTQMLAHGRPSANATINIGVIGTGDRGGGPIPFLNEIPELRVVACSDLIPFRLEQALSKVQGRAKAYPDYRNLLADKDVDAVLVAAPFGTHDKIAVDALEAGNHVFVEKPMAKG